MGLDVFTYMDDIYFRDYASCIEEVDAKREEMLDADKELVRKEAVEINIDDITYIPNGRIYSEYMGYRFESFFYEKKGKYLYVFLNGALMTNKPQLGRWSCYKYINGSTLCIADPMYYKFQDLKLGWYYGDETHNLRVYVSEYIKKIADYLHVEYKNVVLFGSSGGGSAALGCGRYIENCIKVAINPQIILSDWGYASAFEEITHCSLSEDTMGRVDGIYHLKNGRALLMLNIRSVTDMDQLKKLCKELHIDVKYGINVYNDLIVWLFDASLGDPENAHSLSEFYCITKVIEWVIHNFENKKLLCDNEAFIRLVNEFWYYRYKIEFDIGKKQPDFLKIKNCLEIKKRKVVWGAGDISRVFCKNTLETITSNYMEIEYIIDSNTNISDFCGLRIYSPNMVENWEELFIIIAVERGKDEIIDYLKDRNLKYRENFMLYSDLYKE